MRWLFTPAVLALKDADHPTLHQVIQSKGSRAARTEKQRHNLQNKVGLPTDLMGMNGMTTQELELAFRPLVRVG